MVVTIPQVLVAPNFQFASNANSFATTCQHGGAVLAVLPVLWLRPGLLRLQGLGQWYVQPLMQSLWQQARRKDGGCLLLRAVRWG